MGQVRFPMRIRYLISVVAVASTMFAGSIEPAAARVAAATQGDRPVSSCDSPPDTPDATPENRDRFVDLWLARFKDNAWLTRYTELDSVPADIRAEGFHAMDGQTQLWLNTCLLDAMLATAGESSSAEQRNELLAGLSMVIFGKAEIAKMREELAETTPDEESPQQPVPQELTGNALEGMAEDLVDEPSLTSEDQPEADASAPETRVSKNTEAPASRQLKNFVSAPEADPDLTPTALAQPGDLLSVFPIPLLLAAIDALLQLISKIQGILFTLPGLNILASAFYKICAESPTMPLKCSVSLPVGIPIPADVTGDNLPDVTGWLSPLIGGLDVGAKFLVTRLFPGQGKLPAHVYAVYDTPVGKKRIQFGYDGRADTLANRTATTFKLKNVAAAVAGDVNVTAQVLSYSPGSAQSLTFAIKSLVGGSAGVPPAEEDPMAGAVQMSPVPDELTMNARLIHTAQRDEDIFTVGSSTPTKVDAVIDQATTTTAPQSNRRFTAEVDKLPTSVTVNLVGEGDKQTIDYTGSAPIDLVRASDKATPDVSQPDSYTESIYEVHGVPTHVNVQMQGSEDILYTASAKIPEVAFQTKTLDAGVLQRHISAKAHEIPKSLHVTNLTTEDQTAFTYDADSELQDVELAIYDLNEEDETNLQAKATGIPTQMAFTQTKSTGVYDFSANDGIDLIEASLARNGGLLLPLPGDHATVHKVGEALGLDFRLSGFKSAHFDGSEDTVVELGLSPGGQSFDAIADLDDPDVLAKAHVSELPTNLAVTVSPSGESATYTASSSIPLIRASIEKRDTGDELAVEILDVPTAVSLLFDADGSTIDWNASSTTGSVSALAHLTPDSLGGTRTFDAGLTITTIPSQWHATWANGNVLWEAPAPGIGSIDARVTNHGVNHPLPGDHLSAFYRQASGDLDASLHISNLRKAAFTKLTNGDGGGFEAALKMGDHGSFGFAADVILSSAVLKANGEFTNLPSDLTLRSDGGRITYNGDSNPTLTVSVEAGQSAAALAATPTPPSVHGVSVRDGASGADRAVKAKLHLTGLPTSLDLNSPAGTYEVGGYNPSIATLVVDVILTTLAAEPLSLQVQQVVPTASPVDFKFGPFLTDTAGDGTHTLSLNYTANQDLGSLTAEATYGNTDDAKLVISEIPSTISVNAAFGEEQKTVGVTMSHGISDITASYKKVGALNFAASVHLHDVPSAVNLQIGRGIASGGGKEITAPDFTMTASQAGLDIDATASAEIATPADIKAAVNLQVTDLGHTVTGALEGTSLHITSTPATGSFLLVAAGVINMDFNLDFEGGGFTNDGSLDVNVDVKELTLGFENTSDLRLDLGITTGLKGDYSNFTFGLDTDTEIHIYDNLDFFIDWPDPFGTSTIDLFFIDEDIDFDNLIQGFHLNTNTFGTIFSIPVFFFVIGECDVDFQMRPAPGGTTNGSTLSVGQPPNDGEHAPAWLITPDLNILGFSLPDFAMDLIAFFATPYGNGFKVTSGCHVYDLNPF